MCLDNVLLSRIRSCLFGGHSVFLIQVDLLRLKNTLSWWFMICSAAREEGDESLSSETGFVPPVNASTEELKSRFIVASSCPMFLRFFFKIVFVFMGSDSSYILADEPLCRFSLVPNCLQKRSSLQLAVLVSLAVI
jgi:hypothetical protein